MQTKEKKQGDKEVEAKEETVNEIVFIHLKVQSCKLYNNKYTIASTEIANTEIFAFIAIQIFNLSY